MLKTFHLVFRCEPKVRDLSKIRPKYLVWVVVGIWLSWKSIIGRPQFHRVNGPIWIYIYSSRGRAFWNIMKANLKDLVCYCGVGISWEHCRIVRVHSHQWIFERKGMSAVYILQRSGDKSLSLGTPAWIWNCDEKKSPRRTRKERLCIYNLVNK